MTTPGDDVAAPSRRRRWRRFAGIGTLGVVLLLLVGEGIARFGLGLGDPPLTVRDREID